MLRSFWSNGVGHKDAGDKVYSFQSEWPGRFLVRNLAVGDRLTEKQTFLVDIDG